MSTLASKFAPLAIVLADLPFAAPGSEEDLRLAGLVGRKALSLAQLSRAGLPVPAAGAVTSTAHGLLLATDRVAAEIARATTNSLANSGIASGEAISRVRAAIAEAALPDGVSRAIADIYQALGGGSVAVRSSGVAEDLVGASFAGMYESYLNIEGEAAVIDAVRRCWASAWSDRVAAYAQRQGLSLGNLHMGVVIQRLVAADVAGVTFTLDPTTGLEEHMRVEACLGLGEALVAGEMQPDGFVIGRQDGKILESHIAPKQTMLVRAPGAGVTSVPVAETARNVAALDAVQLTQLAALGRKAQAFYGTPQDVEWAFAEGRLWLLQSRPITAISYTGIAGEWTTADFKDGGVAASVCSPYMWSLYDSIWQVAMPGYLSRIKLLRHDAPVQWGKVFYGRPYWNCGEVKRCLHLVPGFNERNFDRDLGIEGTYEGDGVVIPSTPWTIIAALPTLFALGEDYNDRIRKNEQFTADFARIERDYETDPMALGRVALAARYRKLLTRDYFETESAYFHTIYNTSNAKLDFKVELDKANACTKPNHEPLSYLRLLSGLRNLRHLDPLRDLWSLAGRVQAHPGLRAAVLDSQPTELAEVLANAHAAFWAELVAFLQKYKHHSVAELDITQPRWDEDPSFVLQTLRAYVASYDPARDPVAASERQYDVFLAELLRAEQHFGEQDAFARFVAYGNLGVVEDGFFAKLTRCRTYAWWREEMRDCSSRMYALIRRETLAVGQLLVSEGTLAHREDIWQLGFAEVIDLLDGRLDGVAARGLVSERQEAGDGWRRFENPNELGQRFRMGGPTIAPDGALIGIGCSVGTVRARARVIPSIHDAGRLLPGEVLVTKFTDPGWTPLFGTLAAVVTETGGVLSHAAVIAREYGIPAVLAVPDAMRRIKDGQMVLVDGHAGTVTVIAESLS